MSLTKLLSVLAVLLTLIFPLKAQPKESSINISIKNQLGEIITNAEILLFKENRKLKQLKANQLGVARFNNLEPGHYEINIKAIGFNDFKSELISLQNGETKSIEVILEVNVIESNVTVGGDADVESSGTERIINESQIQRLPDDPEKLEKMLRSMAGESATGEKMPITVDGVQTDRLPPKEQIQAIRINQNVFSAQYDNPNGWGIEIYTRSNVDKFSGSVRFEFDDSRLNAADPFLGQRIPSQSKSFSFSLTGPVTKKSMFSLWFYPSRRKSSSAINATVLDSDLNPVALKTTFPTTNNGAGMNSTFAWDVNKKNKIAVAYNNWLGQTTGSNVGGFSLSSRANNNNFQYHNLRFSESYFANENLINQFRLSITFNNNKNFNGSDDVAINVMEAFFGGGSQNNNSNKRFGFEATDDISWQKKRYSLNFGWRVRNSRIDQTSISNFGGTYTFSGRTAPILEATTNPIFDLNGNFMTAPINSLETYRRTLLFQKLGYSPAQIRMLGGGASQFTISGGNPTISVKQLDVAGYVQNSYKLKENLALSFGVRYENQTNISSNLDLAPRLGLIWSPQSEAKRNPLWALPKISVGFGMFYTRYDVNSFLSIKQATDPDRATYLITDANILDLFPNVTSVTQLQQFALPKTQRFIAPNLQTPQMRFFSLSAAKKLPAGFSSNFTFSFSKLVRQTVTRNINAEFGGVRPLGNIGNVYKTDSIGQGERQRFSASLNFPDGKVWGNLTYSFSKAKDNRVSGNGLPFDPFDFSQEFAPAANDGVHSITSYFSYQLPFKLSLGGDFSYQTGSRFNITTGKDTNGDGFFTERPAFATDLTKPNLVQTKYGILDPNPAATDKIIPRNLGRGSSNISFDMSLSKSFGFNEDKANKKPAKQSLNFNVSVENVFNIINRSNPVGNMSSPNFLKVLSVSGSNFIEISDGLYYGGGNTSPRAFSFSMSFRF
jgi:hypothetical protein